MANIPKQITEPQLNRDNSNSSIHSRIFKIPLFQPVISSPIALPKTKITELRKCEKNARQKQKRRNSISSKPHIMRTACRRQRRLSVAVVDDSCDGGDLWSPVLATAATHASDAPSTINTHSGQCRRARRDRNCYTLGGV
ncbi:hypothetical protein Y032_0034g2901 [Ancylostoma ceylanicum]|uniref:Uncharacterized protein n=1 Tax=Ancylostoma ceylanicum TaxID=53326 RepID=A0A016UN37_9BILA|nr:hypothetical protein Y032_0034g2901 [Ancylostoma ceylanicum]